MRHPISISSFFESFLLDFVLKVNKLSFSALNMFIPQFFIISVALELHGEIVPTRGPINKLFPILRLVNEPLSELRIFWRFCLALSDNKVLDSIT